MLVCTRARTREQAVSRQAFAYAHAGAVVGVCLRLRLCAYQSGNVRGHVCAADDPLRSFTRLEECSLKLVFYVSFMCRGRTHARQHAACREPCAECRLPPTASHMPSDAPPTVTSVTL
eukprot:5519619-Pleurochrysis_carterae.AAC.1